MKRIGEGCEVMRSEDGCEVMRSEKDSDVIRSEEGCAGHEVRRKVKW